MNKLSLALIAALMGSLAHAKLPAPDDAAKAKAAEAAAKTAWQGKVDAFQLCKSQDKAAAHYRKTAGSGAKPPAGTPAPCADPGPFVYTPPEQKPAEAASAPGAKPAAAAAAKKS